MFGEVHQRSHLHLCLIQSLVTNLCSFLFLLELVLVVSIFLGIHCFGCILLSFGSAVSSLSFMSKYFLIYLIIYCLIH